MIFENCSSEEHHKTYEDFYYEHIKQINSLKQQLKEKEELIKHLHESCQAYSKSSCDKGLQLIDANEVIEFYSSIACPLPKQIKDNEEIEEMNDMDNAPYFRGGKKAREYKNKWSKK